jgi:hypothetical protein
VREQNQPAEHQAGRQHQDKRRENAPNAARVEVEKREAAALQIVADDAGDQESRDHKEYIDPDEAAGQQRRKRVECDDRHDRDRPQAVNIGPVASMVSHAPPTHSGSISTLFHTTLGRRTGGRSDGRLRYFYVTDGAKRSPPI